MSGSRPEPEPEEPSAKGSAEEAGSADQRGPRSGRIRTWMVRLAQVGATVAVTWFIVDRIGVTGGDLADLGDRWRDPHLPGLAVATLVLTAGYCLSALLWGRMVRELGGGRLGPSRSCEIYFVSNLGRYVPGKVWQLAGLAYLARRSGVSTATATAAAMLMQSLSLGGATAVGTWVLLVHPEVTGAWGPWAAAAVVGVAVLVTLPPVLKRALPLWSRVLGGSGAGLGMTDLGSAFGTRWLLFFALNWIVYGAAFVGMAWAFGIEGSPAALGSAFSAAYVLGYMAFFAPAGIGVREGFLIAFLQPVTGIPAATAAAVIARFWMTTLEILLGTAFVGAAARRTRGDEA